VGRQEWENNHMINIWRKLYKCLILSSILFFRNRKTAKSILNSIKSYREQVQNAYDQAKNYQPIGRFKILLVDDQSSVLDICSMVLKRLRFLENSELLKAENGEKALVLLQNHPDIDLIISGIVMFGMRGDELIQKVKKSYPNIEIGILSGTTSPEIIKKCFDVGAYDYIFKPFAIDEFVNLIKLGLKKRKDADFTKTLDNLQTASRNIIFEKTELDKLSFLTQEQRFRKAMLIFTSQNIELTKTILDNNKETQGENRSLLNYTNQIKWLTYIMAFVALTSICISIYIIFLK